MTILEKSDYNARLISIYLMIYNRLQILISIIAVYYLCSLAVYLSDLECADIGCPAACSAPVEVPGDGHESRRAKCIGRPRLALPVGSRRLTSAATLGHGWFVR
jgi:hypothetical protein